MPGFVNWPKTTYQSVKQPPGDGSRRLTGPRLGQLQGKGELLVGCSSPVW